MSQSETRGAFQVESILSKKSVDGEDFYLIRWLGFGRYGRMAVEELLLLETKSGHGLES